MLLLDSCEDIQTNATEEPRNEGLHVWSNDLQQGANIMVTQGYCANWTESELDSYLTPYTKINSKWNKDLKVRTPQNSPREGHGTKASWHWTWQSFLGYDTEGHRQQKKKIEPQENRILSIKRRYQLIKMVTHRKGLKIISDKGLISKYTENS